MKLRFAALALAAAFPAATLPFARPYFAPASASRTPAEPARVVMAAADAAVEQALAANNRGVADMSRSEFAKAADEFQRALQLDPSFIEAHANLGIAQYAGNDYTNAQKTLNDVLQSDPGNLYAHYVLGLISKNQGQYEAALKQFQFVLSRDATDKDANYYAGFCLSHLRRFAEAIAYYKRALEQNPDDISSIFGLSNAYRAMHDGARAAMYLKLFEQKRKQSSLNTAASIVYGEEGKYAMASDIVPPALQARPHPVPVHFEVVTAASGISFRNRAAHPESFAGSGACFLDYDGDGRPDVFFVNSGGHAALFHNDGNGRFSDVSAAAGFNQLMNGVGCTVGDYDNDGKPDIAVTEPERLLLFHNEGGGRFREVAREAGLTTRGRNLAVAFIDLDHDGYLDIVVTGAGPDGRITAFHNLGTGKFKEISAETGIGQKPAAYAGLVATDWNNDRDIDVVLPRENGPTSIYENNRDGTFTEMQPWADDPVRDGRGVVALDFNHDGWMDLFFTRVNGAPVLLRATGDRRFRSSPLPASNAHVRHAWGATAIDFDNDGFVDIAFIADDGRGSSSIRLYRNRGDGTFEDVSHATGLDRIPLHNARSLITADLDGDGAPDMIVTQAGGPAVVLKNAGGNRNHSLLLRLAGVKDNDLGIGSKVVLRADGLWQKTEVEGGSGYLGQNFTPPLFGLGMQHQADSVSILWPTGVLQDEFPGAGSSTKITELNRKGGSCPILYAWDGRRFRFIDDIVGPGVVGEWVAPHQYDTPDPTEALKIPDGLLAARDGAYEFRFTDQMEEVIYLDKVRLLAVDHPAGTEAFSNDRYQPLPSETAARAEAAAKVWVLGKLRPPASATDQSGRDLLPALLHRDGVTTPITAWSPLSGYAGTHDLILDLGNLRRARSAQLVMNGWTDYYFPTTEWTAYHAGLQDQPPELDIPNGHGGWRTAIQSIGAPAGLPRSMVVDLTPLLRAHIFPPHDYRVRIRTNLAIYWDQISVSTDSADEPMQIHSLDAETAALRYLGYPKLLTESPETYDYADIRRNAGFQRVTGNYTRYGDVLPLLRHSDDRFAVMASGDEIALRFDAHALPPPPRGWTRSFFFYADGFTKGDEFFDADPDEVSPLPRHGLPYPTPGDRTRGRGLDFERYQLEYNTRHIGK
jgi:tetratricopeptide (TPR) repeat protein